MISATDRYLIIFPVDEKFPSMYITTYTSFALYTKRYSSIFKRIYFTHNIEGQKNILRASNIMFTENKPTDAMIKLDMMNELCY